MNIAITIFKMFWDLIKYPIILFLFCIFIIIFFMIIFFVISLFKGRRLKKGNHKRIKKHSLFRKIFIDFPKQFIDDFFSNDPEAFKYQGLIIFEGLQGSGKTSSMVRYTLDIQEEYPKCKTITNLAYAFENDVLDHWRKLTDYTNGIYGVVVVMDELQNWFSSAQSKDFPPEMLQVITQNRKNRRLILGTAQNFYMLAKNIRTQTTEVRRCKTYFGCFTIVHRVRPILDISGDVKEWKNIGWYCYVHDKKLRNSYDTYKVIESLAKSGFKETTEIKLI